MLFISKDINLRLKADALGLRVMDFETQKVRTPELYQGFRTLELPPEAWEQARRDQVLPGAAVPDALTNEFVFCTPEAEERKNLLLRLGQHRLYSLISLRLSYRRDNFRAEIIQQVDLCLAKLLVIDWQLRAINKYGYGGKWAEDADSPGVRQREDAYKIASGEGYEHAPEFLNLRKFICEKIKEKESNYYYFNGAKYWWQSKLNEEIKEIEKELASLAPPAK